MENLFAFSKKIHFSFSKIRVEGLITPIIKVHSVLIMGGKALKSQEKEEGNRSNETQKVCTREKKEEYLGIK